MQNIKNSIFLYLTQRQKSNLLGTLKSYYKKFDNLSIDELCYKFLEDEQYYLNINNPHFEFMMNYLDSEDFFRDMKKFFNFLEYEKKEKEKLEPYLLKQKEAAKELRKKAQEFKMSKLKPTKKQLLYYEKIANTHNIAKKDTKNASRLDLRNWIMEIVNEFS